MTIPIHVVGGGLAGSEAAWTIAQAGLPVILHEMRPQVATPAHHTDKFAELVCSNSFRSDDHETNAVGLLHAEMRRAGSLIFACADANQVPAGSALAVDREGFSQAVTDKLRAHPCITIHEGEVQALPAPESGLWIIATGPLTSQALALSIREATGAQDLAFFDAIAPIVAADSIDYSIAWKQSRWDKEGPGGDKAAYVNCPMNKDEYNAFIDALLAAPKTQFKDWEQDTPYFEGCLPIEVMAERGRDTLRFGPMKPVGLDDPRTGRWPHAVVQLRQDNALGTLFNMVGFQTKLKHGAQAEVFRTIPGLQNAQFTRLGGIHRNTFLNSPQVLDEQLRLKAAPHVRFAGQITGCEGYVESAAIGLVAARFTIAQALGKPCPPPPPTSSIGALYAHITGGHLSGKNTFQPMNANFGLFPPLEAEPTHDGDGKRLKGDERGKAKKRAMSARALAHWREWLVQSGAEATGTDAQSIPAA